MTAEVAVDLSCENRQCHAVLLPEEGVLEVKCNRPNCGAGKGRVVLHRFSVTTGELVDTIRFSVPLSGRKQAS